MTRDQIIDTALAARTDQELAEADRLLSEWLRDHPDDHSMRAGAAQQVAMILQAKERGDADGTAMTRM